MYRLTPSLMQTAALRGDMHQTGGTNSRHATCEIARIWAWPVKTFSEQCIAMNKVCHKGLPFSPEVAPI